MKLRFRWAVVFCVFSGLLRADGLDVFLRQRDRIADLTSFDDSKHTGLSCRIEELSTLAEAARESVRHLKLDCAGAPLGSDVLRVLEKLPHLETLMILRLDVGTGDTALLFQAVPTLTGLAMVYGSLDALDWPASKTGLKEVWLSAPDLRSLPTNLASSESIESLTISDCVLVELKSDFTKMVRLRRISLTNCRIERVADSFRLPKSVEFVRLSFNRISSVPTAVRGLRELRNLDLMGNEVEEVPDWLEELWSTTPVDVNLAENRIRAIPDFVWEFGGRINLSQNIFSTR